MKPRKTQRQPYILHPINIYTTPKRILGIKLDGTFIKPSTEEILSKLLISAHLGLLAGTAVLQ